MRWRSHPFFDIFSVSYSNTKAIMRMPNLQNEDDYPIVFPKEYPDHAVAAKVRISNIEPKDSALLLYSPMHGVTPLRFDGPETEAEVIVRHRKVWARGTLGCQSFQIDFLGWADRR
jgi:hypothetical protein